MLELLDFLFKYWLANSLFFAAMIFYFMPFEYFNETAEGIASWPTSLKWVIYVLFVLMFSLVWPYTLYKTFRDFTK